MSFIIGFLRRFMLPLGLSFWLSAPVLAQGSGPSPDSTAYATYFSPRSRQVLRAAELESTARQWLALHRLSNRSPEQYRQLYDRIRHRLWVAQLQVSATAAELDNEEERAERVVDELRERQDRREHRLTVASIVVSALTSVISGVILARDRGNSSLDAIGVAGGIAGVGLSLPSLLKSKGRRYEHRRNALAALWLDRNEAGLFPPMVWRFMHDQPEAGVAPLRDELVDEWRKADRAKDVYFGEGGRYTADELANRAAMLDQAEAYAKQIQQAISELATTIELGPSAVR